MKNKGLIIFLSSLALILFLIVIVLLSKNNRYDVSSFRQISQKQMVSLMKEDKMNVFLIGSKKCDACKDVIKYLKKAQTEFGFMTNYLAFENINFSEELTEKLNLKTKQSLSSDNKGKEVEKTFGNFLKENGMIPMVIVSEKGKQKGGFIGAYAEDKTIEWFEFIINYKGDENK